METFSKSSMHYSVDSIGAMNDYIRYPSEWEHNSKQFQTIRYNDTQTMLKLQSACAVNALNIYYIRSLNGTLRESGLKKTNMYFLVRNHHALYWPTLKC